MGYFLTKEEIRSWRPSLAHQPDGSPPLLVNDSSLCWQRQRHPCFPANPQRKNLIAYYFISHINFITLLIYHCMLEFSLLYSSTTIVFSILVSFRDGFIMIWECMVLLPFRSFFKRSFSTFSFSIFSFIALLLSTWSRIFSASSLFYIPHLLLSFSMRRLLFMFIAWFSFSLVYSSISFFFKASFSEASFLRFYSILVSLSLRILAKSALETLSF